MYAKFEETATFVPNETNSMLPITSLKCKSPVVQSSTTMKDQSFEINSKVKGSQKKFEDKDTEAKDFAIRFAEKIIARMKSQKQQIYQLTSQGSYKHPRLIFIVEKLFEYLRDSKVALNCDKQLEYHLCKHYSKIGKVRQPKEDILKIIITLTVSEGDLKEESQSQEQVKKREFNQQCRRNLYKQQDGIKLQVNTIGQSSVNSQNDALLQSAAASTMPTQAQLSYEEVKKNKRDTKSWVDLVGSWDIKPRTEDIEVPIYEQQNYSFSQKSLKRRKSWVPQKVFEEEPVNEDGLQLAEYREGDFFYGSILEKEKIFGHLLWSYKNNWNARIFVEPGSLVQEALQVMREFCDRYKVKIGQPKLVKFRGKNTLMYPFIFKK
ncbi:hypothetical protein FGO68_gene9443 [Halteria grandinella]|uniref:Uncharacterized protein n=1 Tax=Halteria grandinella TaxID=5974 RepID=A0A8J8NQ83_HALGN|nr:hypothetical protein FGO68_gene9443 [Halteria grandinella]